MQTFPSPALALSVLVLTVPAFFSHRPETTGKQSWSQVNNSKLCRCCCWTTFSALLLLLLLLLLLTHISILSPLILSAPYFSTFTRKSKQTTNEILQRRISAA